MEDIEEKLKLKYELYLLSMLSMSIDDIIDIGVSSFEEYKEAILLKQN